MAGPCTAREARQLWQQYPVGGLEGDYEAGGTIPNSKRVEINNLFDGNFINSTSGFKPSFCAWKLVLVPRTGFEPVISTLKG